MQMKTFLQTHSQQGTCTFFCSCLLVKKKRVSSIGCKRNNFLTTHYVAFTTIQNCILKIRSAALVSALHSTQHWTHSRGSGAPIQFCLLLSLPRIKMARFFFNVQLSAASNMNSDARVFEIENIEREISSGMATGQAAVVPSSDG